MSSGNWVHKKVLGKDIPSFCMAKGGIHSRPFFGSMILKNHIQILDKMQNHKEALSIHAIPKCIAVANFLFYNSKQLKSEFNELYQNS